MMSPVGTAGGTPDNDDDLQALLGSSNNNNTSSTTAAAAATTSKSMNLDYATRERHVHTTSVSGHGSGLSWGESLVHYAILWCELYPCLGTVVSVVVTAAVLFGIGSLVFNPQQEYGILPHDHFYNIKSKYDNKMGEIDHWCLRGDDSSCRCEDPLVPMSRAELKPWKEAFKVNRKTAQAVEGRRDLDIVFMGESVVEEMDGRWMGQARAPSLQQLEALFAQNFHKQSGASLNAIALGIAGDAANNVLWRLMHGEMTDELNPKVWWLSLGMNDLARTQCSEEVVVLGILRIVEEILDRKPDAHVVINSLFPMTTLRGGVYAKLNDYKDSVGGGKMRAGTTDERFFTPKAPAKKTTDSNDNNRHRALGTVSDGAGVVSLPTSSSRSRRSLRFGMKKGKKQQQPPPGEEPLQKGTEAAKKEVLKQMKKKRTAFSRNFNKDLQERLQNDPEFRKQHRESIVKKLRERREQRRERRNPNPLLKEQHKIRKHVAASRLPVWTSVLVVNRALRKYVEDQHKEGITRVSFVDVTPEFTVRDDNGRPHMNSKLITLRGHPHTAGFEVWEKRVVQHTTKLLETMRVEQPHLFAGDEEEEQQQQLPDPTPAGGNATEPTPVAASTLVNYEDLRQDDDFNDDMFLAHTDDFSAPTDDGE